MMKKWNLESIYTTFTISCHQLNHKLQLQWPQPWTLILWLSVTKMKVLTVFRQTHFGRRVQNRPTPHWDRKPGAKTRLPKTQQFAVSGIFHSGLKHHWWSKKHQVKWCWIKNCHYSCTRLDLLDCSCCRILLSLESLNLGLVGTRTRESLQSWSWVFWANWCKLLDLQKWVYSKLEDFQLDIGTQTHWFLSRTRTEWQTTIDDEQPSLPVSWFSSICQI